MVPTLRLCVLYGSPNKQQLLSYKTLRDWFLQLKWRVFTARYGLSPYIKQIRFVFKGLKQLLSLKNQYRNLTEQNAMTHLKEQLHEGGNGNTRCENNLSQLERQSENKLQFVG
jgi:hypothetical protein